MDIDESSRELILRLQIEDAEDRERQIQRKGSLWGSCTDEQHALNAHTSELRKTLSLVIDARIAQRMRDAIQVDAEILQRFEEREAMERSDRDLALRASGRVPRAADNPEIPRRAARAPPPVATSKEDALTKAPPKRNESTPCIICMERIAGKPNLQAPCGHLYDEKCLAELAEMASSDEALYPPRCCRVPIPMEDLLAHLPRKTRVNFEKAMGEFSVSPKDRVYCSRRVCSRFLGKASVDVRPQP
ncbi:hypothetical protein FRC17_003196, partial [Serendipita sp. 399]